MIQGGLCELSLISDVDVAAADVAEAVGADVDVFARHVESRSRNRSFHQQYRKQQHLFLY